MSRSTLHFHGKTVPEHLKEARLKGHKASAEIHGVEAPGYIVSATDSIKESSFYLMMLLTFLSALSFHEAQKTTIFISFSVGLLLWKTSRSALLGWIRLERLHRLIKEEHWEIQHHRSQEKEELREMYEAKGLKGKLLDDVVEVLMADDNRLLQVMLEEELGLSLEFLEHPLKQALGSFLGVLLASTCLGVSMFMNVSLVYQLTVALLLVVISSVISTRYHGNNLTKGLIWSLSLFSFSLGIFYFLTEYLVRALK